MRNISSQLNYCANRIIDLNCDSVGKEGAIVNFESLVSNYTHDCIMKTVLSIDVDAHNNPESPYLKHGLLLLESWRFVFSMVAPRYVHTSDLIYGRL